MCNLSIVQEVAYRGSTVVINIRLLKDRVDEKYFAKALIILDVTSCNLCARSRHTHTQKKQNEMMTWF